MSEVSNQIMMQQLMLSSQLMQQMNSTGSQKGESVSSQEKELVYAKQGDPNYSEEMDADSNGTVTYDEYMEYCKENAVSPTTKLSASTKIDKEGSVDSDGIKTIHVGKAFEMYSRSSINMPEAKINSEA